MKLVHFALALLFASGCVQAQERSLGPSDGFDLSPTDLERVSTGLPAPDFTLKSKDDALVTLSSFRGKNNVVLVFYRGYW
jgi:cytochrome oxidase Cu insertion factor (SCO1/SenC/PrrC family)